jgi:hypothetical protein
MKVELYDIPDEQVRAVHRASHMAEAIGYRGHNEEQAAKAYDNRQRWMNDTQGTSLPQDRRDALREDEWEIAYTKSHIQQALKLGIVRPAPHPDEVECPHCRQTRRFKSAEEANTWMDECVQNPRNA